jgi:hypothetical protein
VADLRAERRGVNALRGEYCAVPGDEQGAVSAIVAPRWRAAATTEVGEVAAEEGVAVELPLDGFSLCVEDIRYEACLTPDPKIDAQSTVDLQRQATMPPLAQGCLSPTPPCGRVGEGNVAVTATFPG